MHASALLIALALAGAAVAQTTYTGNSAFIAPQRLLRLLTIVGRSLLHPRTDLRRMRSSVQRDLNLHSIWDLAHL
jgi:hypothetical protein